MLDSAFEELWNAIDSGDLLAAEIDTSVLLSLTITARVEPAEAREYLGALVRNAAVRQPTPTGATALRIMAALGSADVKRAAGRELGELTADGIFAHEWATDAGKPVPRQAWRSYDVFGDGELIVVTFGYGDAEHAVLVTVNRTARPLVTRVAVVSDGAKAVDTIRDMSEPLSRQEEISLAEARRRVEGPLAVAADEVPRSLEPEALAFLPLARSRVRRLPAGDSATTYTAADRAAAVAEFLASPHAAVDVDVDTDVDVDVDTDVDTDVDAAAGAAVDADVVRFWAEILTRYSGIVPDEPPYQVGPGKLSSTLLTHVVSTFTLSEAQREGLQPAVTAWARWAAERQRLDEAAVTHLLNELPTIFGEFDEAYAEPFFAITRSYQRDAVTSDIEMAALNDLVARREFAVPMPDDRGEILSESISAPGLIDAADPGGRAALVAAEFAHCKPGAVVGKPFVAAVTDVVEELWSGSPAATWEDAKKLIDDGKSRHDILHTLAGQRP